jgi:hypothetical protein
MKHKLSWVAAVVVPFAFAAVAYTYWPRPQAIPVRPPAMRAVHIEYTPPEPDLEPAEPSSETPILSEAARAEIEKREHALAAELSKMWTSNSGQLVSVVDDAARNVPASPSVTLLLAIAHAETNGKILDVSEAGAVGLAQATPIAIKQEDFSGPMFVTADYLTGARAYIMKKPLGDADTIASHVIAGDTPKSRARARKLLESAMALRREGVDELDLLQIFGSKRYFKAIEDADDHNTRTLKRLRHLLDKGSKSELRAFRDKTRREYRALKRTQVVTWARYQHDLIARRDAMLVHHFHASAAQVKREAPYEAGEYLGEQLDLRFSAKKMAAFLVQHLERKAQEARTLAADGRDVEAMTAALYNGGSHNVKRMLAGLIASLPETQRYMKKVPATRRRLDRSVEIAGGTLDLSGERTLR